MKVAIDAGPLYGHRTGVGVAAAGMIDALAARDNVELIELGEAGLVNRTYGGATISLVTSEPVISERGRAYQSS